MPNNSVPFDQNVIQSNAAENLLLNELSINIKTDRMFGFLFCFQYICAIGFALIQTPMTWDGGQSSIHPHVIGVCIRAKPIAQIY